MSEDRLDKETESVSGVLWRGPQGPMPSHHGTRSGATFYNDSGTPQGRDESREGLDLSNAGLCL